MPTFLVTFTLPESLRELARSHQRFFYRLLFQTSARALQELAAEPRFLGGRIGLLGVLQTWTRDLRFHPHVHYLVPAIGVQPDGTICRPRNPAFLVPVLALGQRFRTLFRRALVRSPFAAQLPRTLWTSSWVVDCRAVGSGEAALRYLAPYIFRVALSNRRLVRLHNGRVTFAYRDGRTKQMRTTTLEAHAFLARFLQHVLPRGFVKVRCYGLFSKTARALLERVRLYLLMTAPAKREAPSPAQTASPAPTDALRCVRCGGLLEVTLVQPVRSRGPPEWKKDDTNSILTATHMGRTASCASLMRPADCMRGLWKQARAVRTIPVNWLQPRRCHSLEE